MTTAGTILFFVGLIGGSLLGPWIADSLMNRDRAAITASFSALFALCVVLAAAGLAAAS